MPTAELATMPDTTGKRAFLVARFADKYGIEPSRMLETLKQTCFRTERGITNEQMAALLLVCEANDLNPFAKMVYALLDKAGNVVPFIGFDGWVSLVNRHPQMAGYKIMEADDGLSATCRMWRRDWLQPGEITTYLAEVKRGSTPWSTSPRQMLQVRSYVRCARVTFGFPGLHDEYDARQIVYGPEVAQRPERIRNVLQPPVMPPVNDGFPDDEPMQAKPLAVWIAEMLGKDDQESALVIVDEARGVLPDDQHIELHRAYLVKWKPNEE